MACALWSVSDNLFQRMGTSLRNDLASEWFFVWVFLTESRCPYLYIILAGKRRGENEKGCMGETGSCSYCGAVLCTHIFVTVIVRHVLCEIDPAHADT